MIELRWGSATDVGMVRPNNEDQLLVASPLFAVADGMGGHAAGEVASLTAVEALRAAFTRRDGTPPSPDDLVEAVQAANRAVWDRAKEQPDVRRMGTTLTAAALVEDDGEERLAITNIGDSRTYLFRDGELQRITDDHNVPGDMVKQGRLTIEEAAVHPQKNVVTRHIGGAGDVEVDLWQILPFAGDRLLLASDGLFDEVGDDEIARILRRLDDPQDAAAALVDAARAAGGHDNITVVIVEVAGDGDRAVSASKAVAAESRRIAAKPAEPEAAAAPVAPAPTDDDAGGKSRAGAAFSRPSDEDAAATTTAPRRRGITGRTVAFVIALIVVLGGAFGTVTWYGRAAWHVGVDDAGNVAIFRGRPGGFLWLSPAKAEPTDLQAFQLTGGAQDRVEKGIPVDSLADGRRTVAQLREEADDAGTLNAGSTTSTTPTTVTSTTTSTPGATTATAPPPTAVSPTTR